MESMDGTEGTEGTERTKGTGEKPYPACANCRHFRQYYLKFGQRYRELDFGHCACFGLSRRNAADAGCSAITAGERGCAKDRRVCRVCEKRKTRGKPIKGFPLVSACEKIVP